jgi:hypothetical protein
MNNLLIDSAFSSKPWEAITQPETVELEGMKHW